MPRSRPRPRRQQDAWATLASLLLAFVVPSCEKPSTTTTAPPPDEPPGTRLGAILKNHPGDWRSDTDAARGLPAPPVEAPVPPAARTIELPPPTATHADAPLARTLADRRSRREFSAAPLSLADLSFLLWAGHGITGELRDETGSLTHQLRAAPSGGARYPLDTFVLALRVEDLPPGVFLYHPSTHRLVLVREDQDLAAAVGRACFGAEVAGSAAVVFAWAAVPYRTEWKYGPLAGKMIALEAGHACQNVLLAAEAAALAACPLLGYHQPTLDEMLALDGDSSFTIYLASAGRPAAPD